VKKAVLAVFPKKAAAPAARRGAVTGAAGAAGGAGGWGGVGGAGGGGVRKFYTLDPEDQDAVRQEYARVCALPRAINTELYTIPGFGTLHLTDVLSINGLLEDKLICAILQCLKNDTPVVIPPVKNTIMYPCFFSMIRKSDAELHRLARIFNIADKNYLKGMINWIINIPGHWFFCGIFFNRILEDVWHYDIFLGDSIKGISRDDVLRKVQLFIRAAVSYLHQDAANNNVLLPASRFSFKVYKHNNHADRISPKQIDNTSCGVHCCINAYFFMRQYRLATYDDYNPDKAGVQGLKNFLFSKLLQANAMALQYPQLIPAQHLEGPAGELLHQYNALNIIEQTEAERLADEEASMLEYALDQVAALQLREKKQLDQQGQQLELQKQSELLREEARQLAKALRISAAEITNYEYIDKDDAKGKMQDIIPLYDDEDYA